MTLAGSFRCEAEALIGQRLGLRLPEDRTAELDRVLLEGFRASRLPSPEAYLARLAALPEGSPEWGRIASGLTVGETYFVRDHGCFEALEGQVLPGLIARRRSEGRLFLRVWSAACATGEEPYSLAILLDRLLPDRPDWAVTILATDINAAALDAARAGLYREWSFREAPPWIRERYFRRHRDQTFELDPTIRRMVAFAPLNLAGDGYPGLVTNTAAMDLILCRNVLMYFTREAQRATVARLQRALVADGWLVVSPAEASAELFGPLVTVNFPGAILYRKEPGSPAPLQPSWEPDAALVYGLEPSPSLCVSEDVAPQPRPARPPAGEAEAPSGEETPLERARALGDQGNLEEAQRLCEAALESDGLDPEAHLLLAAICQEREEIPAAVAALRRALYLAPDSAPAHFLLGSLLLREGKRRRGRRCMETVVTLLGSVPRDEPVPGSGGLTAGRLLETARAYLESTS